jgi:hypothetical protein
MLRLVEHMGKGTARADDSVESLVLEWSRSGSAPAAVYQALLSRFRTSLLRT